MNKRCIIIERVVSILCSGMGLGVYIPSLLLEYQLNQRGVKTDFFVVESYFIEEKLEKLKENKKAFRESFSVALLGHRMAKGDVRPELNIDKVESLLTYWEENSYRDFIVMSGHWPVILETYIDRVGSKNLLIDAVRMDSDVAPSWKNFNNNKNYYNEIWLFHLLNLNLPYRISVNNSEPIPFIDRQDEFIVHGGGWGMGLYSDKVAKLKNRDYILDIVVYAQQEVKSSTVGEKYYLLESDWSPWVRNSDNKHEFPKMYEVDENGILHTLYANGYQSIYDICKKCKGIISKPGGGTLVDSLASATPIIFTEPIAKHEKSNALLWEKIGFGISYDKWEKMGFSIEVLERLHHNILEKRSQIPDYINEFLSRYEMNSTE